MKDLINKILGRRKKKEGVVDEEELSKIVNPDVKLSIEVDGESGEFTVEVDCTNLSDKCAENLSLLMYHTSTGGLLGFITESLTNWQVADKDEVQERTEFCNKISQNILAYESMLIGSNEHRGQEQSNKVAVRASEVFNLKELNQ
jgi:hypothetical protein